MKHSSTLKYLSMYLFNFLVSLTSLSIFLKYFHFRYFNHLVMSYNFIQNYLKIKLKAKQRVNFKL